MLPYICIVGEAVNVSSGLGYNGVDEKGKARWNLVDNADILQIEVLVMLNSFAKILYIVCSFNIHMSID